MLKCIVQNVKEVKKKDELSPDFKSLLTTGDFSIGERQ